MPRLAIALALVLAACGISVGEIEEDIATGVADQLAVEVASVNCPEDLDLEAGLVFTCEVELADGQVREATVTMKAHRDAEWRL